MLPYDDTPALAARARLAARAVVGLVLDEQRSAQFVYEYSSANFRLGIAGEAERKAELLSAIERESLLLVSTRIERSLPRAVGSRFSRLSEPEATAVFRQSFLTFLAGSLAWDREERESFRKDMDMYLRLAARESRLMQRGRGAPPVAGAFVDRCAFLVDPSMLAQAREAAARYQVQLESCADEALRAAFRGLRGAGASVSRAKPRSRPRPKAKPKRKAAGSTRRKPKARPRRRKSPPRARRKVRPRSPARKSSTRRKAAQGAKPAPRRKSRPRSRTVRKKSRR